MAIRKATDGMVERQRKRAARAAWEEIIREMKSDMMRANSKADRELFRLGIMEARAQASAGVLPSKGKYGGVKVAL